MSRALRRPRLPALRRSTGATAVPPGTGGGRSRLRRTAVLSGLAVVLVGGLLAVLLLATPLLAVKTVRVSGVGGALADSVRSAAAISEGTPLARVSEDSVRERVLKDRRIGSLEVHRRWPSTIELQAKEREAAIVLRGTDGAWLVDPTGVAFEQVSPPHVPRKLPSVQVVSGAGAEVPQATAAGLVELWRERPDPAPLEGDLGVPRLREDGTVAFTIGQVKVEWGTPTDTTLKWQVVQRLIGQQSIDPQGGLSQTIDVVDPMRPLVTGLPPAPGG